MSNLMRLHSIARTILWKMKKIAKGNQERVGYIQSNPRIN